VAEIEDILRRRKPRGIVPDLSRPAPTGQLPWQSVLDKEPWTRWRSVRSDLRQEAILALIYKSGHHRPPQGRCGEQRNIPGAESTHQLWLPQREGGGTCRRRRFYIWIFHSYSRRRRSATADHIPKFQPGKLERTVSRGARQAHRAVPTMINLLTQFASSSSRPESWRNRGLWRLSDGPRVVPAARASLPHVKWLGYGPDRNGLLTDCTNHEHTLGTAHV